MACDPCQQLLGVGTERKGSQPLEPLDESAGFLLTCAHLPTREPQFRGDFRLVEPIL